jgi:hypothetical protein
MNSLTKNLAELGTKMKTGTEKFTAKAGEAIANAKVGKEQPKTAEEDPTGEDAALAVPSVVGGDAEAAENETIPSGASGEQPVDTTPSKKPAFGEAFTGFASQFKRNEEPDEVSDLLAVLSTLFEVDPKAKKTHEMVEALDLQGIHTWRSFLLMAEEDIQTLTKNKGSVPISKNAIRMLTYLKQFTLHNIDSGVPNAKDPELYTRDAFDAYVEDLQLGRKSALNNKEEQGEEADKPSTLKNIRGSITGFASKLKPNVEDGSIADIYTKAKAKVMRGNNKNSNNGDKSVASGASVGVPSDDASVGASSVGASSIGAESADPTGVPGDIAFEAMKKNVDDLASKLERTARNVTNKEEVQKLMVPLLSNLKKSQDRFGAMIEARKKKKAEKEAEKEAATEAAATADAATAESSEEKNKKLKNLFNSAENATKRAFENAEKVARQAARKAGILDDEKETEAVAPPKEEEEEPAAAAQVASEEAPKEAEEAAATPAAAEETEPVEGVIA